MSKMIQSRKPMLLINIKFTTATAAEMQMKNQKHTFKNILHFKQILHSISECILKTKLLDINNEGIIVIGLITYFFVSVCNH